MKWLPYAVISVALVTGGSMAYGYHKGVQSTQKKMAKEVNKALAQQLTQLKRVAAADMEAALRATRREMEITEHVEKIEIPQMPLTCVLNRSERDHWLQFHDDTVRAARGDT